MASIETQLVGAVAGIAVGYVFLTQLLRLTQDASEPQAIATTIPFVSPIFGMMLQKSAFYLNLLKSYQLPIYTLRMPGSRIYVVNSTALISAIQRQYKTLAFPPIEVKGAINVCAPSPQAVKILNDSIDTMPEDWDSSTAFYKVLHRSLAPGPQLDSMNRTMIASLTTIIEQAKAADAITTPLFAWVRGVITAATTEAVYGPQNPLRPLEMQKKFWTFEDGVANLVLGMPESLASTAVAARAVIAQAFEKYFRNHGQEQGSGLIQARVGSQRVTNMPLADTAKFEVAGGIAILSNTYPSAFWLVYHIFSDPDTLRDCREEVKSHITETVDANGVRQRTLDATRLKRDSPVLLSTFKEALRFRSVGTSVRMVTADHTLNNQYLLKKDNILMMPSVVQHYDPEIWGDDVGEFKHRRFLAEGSRKRPNPAAFRAFGGGTTLCPGRHFATTEVLVFAAMMMLNFDIAPVQGSWQQMTTHKAPMWASVPCPDGDVEVKITVRGGEPVAFSLSDSEAPIELVTEDMGTAGSK